MVPRLFCRASRVSLASRVRACTFRAYNVGSSVLRKGLLPGDSIHGVSFSLCWEVFQPGFIGNHVVPSRISGIRIYIVDLSINVILRVQAAQE